MFVPLVKGDGCAKRSRGSRLDDLFHPPDNSIFEHDLDTVGMVRRLCEDPLDDTFCQFAGSLILLLNHPHLHAGLDVRSVLAVHFDN